jgi:Uma2 family endonuclease
MAAQPSRRHFTVDEYYAMAQAGILGEDDRVELIDGEIVEMAPIGPGHARSVNWLVNRFVGRIGDRALALVQNPVHLDRYNEPEPDFALVRSQPDLYRQAHPTPAEIYLIIEVADSSLATDLANKVPLYARAGVAEVWVVDLPHARVLVHREPSANGYRLLRTVPRGERLSPLAFPDCEISADDLLG